MTQHVSPPRGSTDKAAPVEGPPAWRVRLGRADVRTLTLLGVLAALVLIGGITQPDAFLDTRNLQLVLTQASVIGIVTVGVTFVIISGGIDLSVGAIVALSSVWATTVATQEYGFAGILFTAIVVGVGCGLVNGLLISFGGMVPFIATLAMLASARGLALQITDGRTQVVTVPSVLDLAERDSYVLGIPPLVLVFAAVTVVGWLVLNRTTFGRRTVAVGGNAEAGWPASTSAASGSTSTCCPGCAAASPPSCWWPSPAPARTPTATSTNSTPSPPRSSAERC